jgi:hypothetical protein
MLNRSDEKIIKEKSMEKVKKVKSLTKLTKNEVDYLTEKIIEIRGEEISNFKKEMEKRAWITDPIDRYLQTIFTEIESWLKNSKSDNIEEALEDYFKIKDFENRLGDIESKVWDLKLGQKEEARKLVKEINELIKESKKLDEDIQEHFSMRISEINGDIMAILTDGYRGSTRKVRALERSGEFEEYHKKKKSNDEE